MTRIKVVLLALLGLICLAPVSVSAFSYQGATLGLYFSGDYLFDRSLLLPGQENCSQLTVENRSSDRKSLGLVVEGFKEDPFFQHVRLQIKAGQEVLVSQAVQDLSEEEGAPIKILDLKGRDTKELKLCLSLDRDLSNQYQGYLTGPVSFRFGFVGEVFGPPLALSAPATPSVTAPSPSSPVPGQVGGLKQLEQAEGEQQQVKGERAKEEVADFFTLARVPWWCWLLLGILLALILFLIWKRRRRQEEEVV